MSRRVFLLVPLLLAATALADGPSDNVPAKVRPIPPRGISVGQQDRDELAPKLEELGKEIAELAKGAKGRQLELLPDVEIFHKAVHDALKYNEFYNAGELKVARAFLDEGLTRAKQLRSNRVTWNDASVRRPGMVMCAYRSRIDGSVQPYGLVVPASYRAGGPTKHRLDVWLHGRGETLSELNFLAGCQRSRGQFTPRDAFVLHPYGRYCNAFKLAGEVDVLEAIEDVMKRYHIDDRRVVMRGFSMGGAGCWTLASHYPGRWVAAAPGAGFAETPKFLDVFQHEKVAPTWYEKQLWRVNDCPGWVGNFYNLPVVAYSGEKDSQKQAADVMADAFKAEGLELTHLIGPNTGHGYHPETRKLLDARIDRLAEKGRPRVPRRVRFVTYSLRYPESFWVRLEGLEEQFNKASIDAEVTGGEQVLRVKTHNVSAFTLSFGPGDCPFVFAPQVNVLLDGFRIRCGPVGSDHSWSVSFHKSGVGWQLGKPDPSQLRKKPGLQGPIDDAFLDSFLVVRPTGKNWHDAAARWARGELAHTEDHWRKQFRGIARVKDDTAVTAEDVAKHNLILWGDPGSNAVIKKILDKLPLTWTEKELKIGATSVPSGTHMPALIYPNPLNPSRYVVLNSGFTIREYDHLNNARQVPKLPDWAVLDVTVPPSSRWPAKVVGADFFDESWKVRAKQRD